jgi:hypothetical protein
LAQQPEVLLLLQVLVLELHNLARYCQKYAHNDCPSDAAGKGVRVATAAPHKLLLAGLLLAGLLLGECQLMHVELQPPCR